MPWSNGPLVLYHGTDSISANAIRLYGIDPSKFRSRTDFGSGFYVTTVLHQARQWANQRCRRISGAFSAEVLQYEVDRTAIENLSHLAFVVDDQDYYDFVAYCRSGGVNHGPPPRSVAYEVIYDPVSLWPQKLVISACDQLLFSDPQSLTHFDKPTRSYSPAGGYRFF